MARRNYTIKNGKKKSPLNILILLTTILILGSLFFITQKQGNDEEPAALNTAPATLNSNNPLDKNSGYDKETKEVYVITDKWSLLNIPNQDYEINVNNFTAKLVFTPMTGDEYRDLLKKNPTIISNTLARFYDSAKDLTCSKDGCKLKGNDIDVTVLATPGAIPNFGDIYKNYNIDSILYKATLNLPLNSDVVGISLPNSRGTSLIYGSSDDGSSTAYNYVSNAFGVVYTPTVLWNADSGFDPKVRYAFEDTSLKRGEAVKNSDAFGLLSKGLAYSNPLTYNLNPSLLTYLSSPSTGCGPVALCIPGLLDSKFQIGRTENITVCATDGGRARVLITYGQGSFSSSYKSFIPGLSNYKSQSSDYVTGVLGDPELVTGEQKFFTFEASLLDEGGIVAIAGGKSVLSDNLPKPNLSQLFDGKFKECKA